MVCLICRELKSLQPDPMSKSKMSPSSKSGRRVGKWNTEHRNHLEGFLEDRDGVRTGSTTREGLLRVLYFWQGPWGARKAWNEMLVEELGWDVLWEWDSLPKARQAPGHSLQGAQASTEFLAKMWALSCCILTIPSLHPFRGGHSCVFNNQLYVLWLAWLPLMKLQLILEHPNEEKSKIGARFLKTKN